MPPETKATPQPANSFFDFIRAKRSVIALALDLLSDRRNAVPLLFQIVEVINQKIWLSDASIFRITQRWLLLAEWHSLLANNFVTCCLTPKAIQLQIIDQALNLWTWLFYPPRSTTRADKHETNDQCCNTHFFMNHDFQRTWRIETINILRHLRRFHRIGCAKRATSFLHPDSVGAAAQVDMLAGLSKRGAVCASA